MPESDRQPGAACGTCASFEPDGPERAAERRRGDGYCGRRRVVDSFQPRRSITDWCDRWALRAEVTRALTFGGRADG